MTNLPAHSVKIVTLPGLREKGDVSDWLDAGGTKEKLLEIVNNTPVEEPVVYHTETTTPDEDDSEKKTSDAAKMIEMFDAAELFHTPHHELCACLLINNVWHTLLLNGKDIKIWLAREFYNTHGRSPGSEAISEALRYAEAKAKFDSSEQPLFIRIAPHESEIYIDLGNNERAAVRISNEGWELVVGKLPIYFRRPNGYRALPLPQSGGQLGLLRPFVNVQEEAHWRLLIGWLVGALYPEGPYPILALYGEQGSAKSTLARLLRLLLDPNSAPLRTFSKDTRDLMITATNSRVMAYDNLSYLKSEQSDALCRISTGGGFATRTLYENSEETIFDATRPIILNGIPEVTTKPDLADRAIALRLSRIAPEDRKTEREIWAEFEKVQPLILGALLDVLVVSLRNLPITKLPEHPRMADFASRVVAAEEYLGWPQGDFLADYESNREEINETVIESSPLAQKIIELISNGWQWHGTAADLLNELNSQLDEAIKRLHIWPKTANRLGSELRRLAPVLQGQSVLLEFEREPGGQRNRFIRIEKEITAEDL